MSNSRCMLDTNMRKYRVIENTIDLANRQLRIENTPGHVHLESDMFGRRASHLGSLRPNLSSAGFNLDTYRG
eukprot:3273927-Pleurochrysis_carterae.AAC.2